MKHELDFTVENKLVIDKRDINIYHPATNSAHIISHSSSITLPLRTVSENDYLDISVVRGPGNLWKDCLINLPSWVNFEFFSEGNVTVTHSDDVKRTLLKIPPGPPTWELRLTRASGSAGSFNQGNVTISDNGKG
ncbi:MAG: hypothetical protein GY950_16250 [bacterium]|nr:hypothetical protein [bacterium]